MEWNTDTRDIKKYVALKECGENFITENAGREKTLL